LKKVLFFAVLVFVCCMAFAQERSQRLFINGVTVSIIDNGMSLWFENGNSRGNFEKYKVDVLVYYENGTSEVLSREIGYSAGVAGLRPSSNGNITVVLPRKATAISLLPAAQQAELNRNRVAAAEREKSERERREEAENASNRASATPITANQWRTGDIWLNDVWHSFSVTSGTVYRIWIDDLWSPNSKTADIRITVYYSDFTFIRFSNNNMQNLWNYPVEFTANKSGTVYIKLTTGRRGSYGIVYSTGETRPPLSSESQSTASASSWTAPSNSTTLTANQWRNGNITSGSTVWYSFSAASGTAYRIWVDDNDANGTPTTADVVITGRYSDGTQIWSGNQDENWDSPASFTANRTGTVYIAVTPYDNRSAGSYGLVYSTGTTRPSQSSQPQSTASASGGNTNTSNAYELYQSGDAAYNRGDYDRAIADFTQWIRLEPNNADAYHWRASSYYRKSDWDRAIADYSQAIRINPNNASYFYNRCLAYYSKNDYAQAREDVNRALQINPNHQNAQNMSGNIRQMGF
jgi:TolA-binding protein